MSPSFAPLKPRTGFRVRVNGIWWSNHSVLSQSSGFILKFQDPRSFLRALDGQDTDIWEPEAAGEMELWNEIGGYSIRGAPGSRMSQFDRTKGLNSPPPS